MAGEKQNKQLPKREYRVFIPKSPFVDEEAISNNQEHARLSKQYFDSDLSLPNIAKGVYHYWMSTPGLGGEPENKLVISGTAPVAGLGRLKSLKKVYDIYKRARGIKQAKAISEIPKVAEAAKQSSQNFFKKAFLPESLNSAASVGRALYKVPIYLGTARYVAPAVWNTAQNISGIQITDNLPIPLWGNQEQVIIPMRQQQETDSVYADQTQKPKPVPVINRDSLNRASEMNFRLLK